MISSVIVMVLSRHKTAYFYQKIGYKPPTIKKLLQEETILVTHQSVHKFLCFYRGTGIIKQWKGLGGPSKLTPTVPALVEPR